jgi:hypothetical protein
MQNLNYKSLLLKYRNNTFSGHDLSNLWECFSNKINADLIRSIFLDDLNSFVVDTTNAGADFKTIFKNIQNKIEENEAVTYIYNIDDIRNLHFSDNLELETLAQGLDQINLSTPIEYAVNGKTEKFSEN